MSRFAVVVLVAAGIMNATRATFAVVRRRDDSTGSLEPADRDGRRLELARWPPGWPAWSACGDDDLELEVVPCGHFSLRSLMPATPSIDRGGW